MNIEEHAQGLLEHLSGSDQAGVTTTYLKMHELSAEDGLLLVGYLADRGLARNHSTFDGPDCDLTGKGLAVAQELRADRMSPARRLGTLHSRMLAWLEKHHETKDWNEFLASDEIHYHDAGFTAGEVQREATYLYEHGLIKSIHIDAMPDGNLYPELTVQGRHCLIHFGGDVNEYLNRGARPSTTHHTTHNTTTITMTDSVGNIANASAHVVQNVNAGLDTTKVLEFAGAVRQTLPVLGLAPEDQQTVDSQAEELHEEAESAAPDRGRMRGLLDSILQTLGTASATAAQKLLENLGTEALQAIGA